MTKKRFLLSVLSVGAASVMLAASLSACGGSSGNSSSASSDSGSSGSSYTTLDDGKANAKKCLSEYESGKNAASFAFAKGAYDKAAEAAEKVNADSSQEDVDKAAEELGLTRLVVTDESGTITVSYPEGDKDKSIKDVSDVAVFYKVVKGISDKYMKDPEYKADGDTYSITAGVKTGDGGAAVVGYDDPGYAAVCGGDIAEKCGDNTVVISKDKVVSSSLDGIAVGSSLDDIGVKKDDLKKDSFTLTADSKKYNAAAVTKGDMTVIAAIPA